MGKVLSGQFTPWYVRNDLRLKETCQTTIIADDSSVAIAISMISAAGFALNCQDRGAVIFSITLKEIDHEIRDRQFLAEQAEITNQELVASKLPVSYHDLVDVFSKGDS